MNLLLLAAEVESTVTPERIVTTFGIDWPHLLSQIISFSIVCFILYRFAYKPILKMLEARREQIALGIANAEQIKAELAKTEAQRQEVISQANVEASQLIEEARVAATRLQQLESQKAIATAEQIMARAREAAEQDHVRMLAELKREVGKLVVQTTSRVVGKVLTSEDQKRLADEAAKEFKSST
jgi:F-type H+-transporting ATPase subunit b